jgi:protein O-GlcNAc transferase
VRKVIKNLGEALQNAFRAHQARRLAEAERLYEQIIRAEPRCFDALHLLGILNAENGRRDEAERLIRKALAVNPHSAEALNNYANVLQSLNRFEEALASFDRALKIMPAYAEALNNRGNVLHDLRRHEEALESYERALAVRPNYAKALANRAEVLRELNRHEDALASCDQALAIDPKLPEALNNRGIVLHALNRQREALACYDRALLIRPDYAKAFSNRARVLQDMKRYDEALACYERALDSEPENSNPLRGWTRSEHLLLKRQICDWSAYSRERDWLGETVDTGRAIILPFVLLGWLDDAPRQRRAAQRFVDGLKVHPRQVFPEWVSSPHERIRLAYLSPDFCDHAVSQLTAELFELHDRERFELYAFSLGIDDGSEIRKRLSKSFERFVDVRLASDVDVARQIRALEIDIAVDLGGLTKGSRPGILAHRPAPIQVNYLGYPGTMGADFIDYIIVDPFIVPAVQQAQFTENLVHLPGCYQVNDRKRSIAGFTPTRGECGLPESGFVFASFNNTYKITPDVFDCWMRLLHATPGSVLWLLSDNQWATVNLRAEAKSRGVSTDRIVFADRKPLAEHLARHRLADLFLDNLPYNAHVTASDALWAGLPVLTCAGLSFAARVAGSLLHAVGLPELVTGTLSEYEALALKLTRDRDLLRALRERLADNRLTAPLFDSPRYCRRLERAYQEMYARWQRAERPRSLAISETDFQHTAP